MQRSHRVALQQQQIRRQLGQSDAFTFFNIRVRVDFLSSKLQESSLCPLFLPPVPGDIRQSLHPVGQVQRIEFNHSSTGSSDRLLLLKNQKAFGADNLNHLIAAVSFKLRS